jgi:hypothetical protein
MTFKNNFIVDIVCDGKTMRVKNGEIKLPFGSEYSVFMKNIDSRKAVASLYVDGKDVLDGNLRVVMPGSSITVNGFMKGSESTNKFKFTKKTKRISKYRGDFPDDGIIRVEYWFEKHRPEIIEKPWYTNGNLKSKSTDVYGINDYSTSNTYFGNYDTTVYSSSLCSSNFTEDGITVNGSKLDESFVYADVGTLEDTSSVIAIRLVGYDIKRKKKVLKPVYNKTKLVCQVCGTKSKSSVNYCRHCGNNLN